MEGKWKGESESEREPFRRGLETEKPRGGDSLVMMIDGPDAEHLRGRAGSR